MKFPAPMCVAMLLWSSVGVRSQDSPTIMAAPRDQLVRAGTDTSFSVTVTGASPLSYQWFFNSNILSGATNSNLVISNVQPPQTGDYSVTVSNAFGMAPNTGAHLEVCWLAHLSSSNQFIVGDTNGWSSAQFDPLGNLCLGRSNSIAEFDPNGGLLWQTNFSMPSNSVVQSLIFNDTGGIYLVLSGEILKLDSGGQLIWRRPAAYTAPRGIVDSTENFYFTATSGSKILLLKIDANGFVQWGATNDIINSAFGAYCALAPGGDVYVGAVAQQPNALVLCKYDTQGNMLWQVRTNRGSGFVGYAESLLVDRQTNVFLSGFEYAGAPWDFHYTTKFDRDGNQLWSIKHLITQDFQYSFFRLDDEGNLFVAGDYYDYFHDFEKLYTAKFDPGGKELWSIFSIDNRLPWFAFRGMFLDSSGILTILQMGWSNSFSATEYRFAQNLVPGLPRIVSQSSDLRAAAGDWVVLSAAVTGAPPPAVQWRFNGVSIAGATNLNLALTNLNITASGHYSLAATNEVGCAVSRDILLTVSLINPFNLSVETNVVILYGDAGRSYQIEGSTNLMDWSQIFTINLGSAARGNIGVVATNLPRMFYRARTKP